MIAKPLFSVYRIKDGRLAVESPLVGDSNTNMLLVSSDSVQVKDRSIALPQLSNVSANFDICGVLGLLDLCFGRYLICISERELAATLQSHKIWKILKTRIISVGFSYEKPKQQLLKSLDEPDLAKFTIDSEYLVQLQQVLDSGSLYYSTTYDITQSIQHNYISMASKKNPDPIDRYWFNRSMTIPLLNSKQADVRSPWIVKSIMGFVSMREVPILVDSKTFSVVLISRVNTHSLGTRYLRRGIDESGNAANNVESEQIVFNQHYLFDKKVSSFVQVRGSVPVIWGQDIDLKYRPEMHIADLSNPLFLKPVFSHFNDLMALYLNTTSKGNIICINLLDDKGFEAKLSQTYEQAVSKFHNKKFQYEGFPINKWCKGMNYRNMDILIARISTRLTDSSVFSISDLPSDSTISKKVSPYSYQSGVIRLNCLDSLDRTNLTMSLVAKYMLPLQLISIAPRPSDVFNDKGESFYRQTLSSFSNLVSGLWADSGDYISLIYAGTRALRSDITRTGRRSLLFGPIDDGLNSLTRYYLNNFSDGKKQDAYDLLTGKVSGKQILSLAQGYGLEKAKQISSPFIPSERGVGSFIPSFIVNNVEPFLQAALDFRSVGGKNVGHYDSHGKPTSYVGFIATIVKIYAPHSITNVIEFSLAMGIIIYLIVLIKVFQIKGEMIVDKPRLVIDLVDDLD